MNLTIVARALISVLKLKAIRLKENPDRLVSVGYILRSWLVPSYVDIRHQPTNRPGRCDL